MSYIRVLTAFLNLLFILAIPIVYSNSFLFFFYFLVAIVTLLLLDLPDMKLVSPKSILYFYYLVWFVVAPLLASRYRNVFTSPNDLNYSYLMLSICFLIARLSIDLGQYFGGKVRMRSTSDENVARHSLSPILIFTSIFLSASICFILVMASSGGIVQWVGDPGNAFLNRAGSGFYVVLGHFFTYLASAYAGYIYFVSRFGWSKLAGVIFVVWLFLFSIVIGSKYQLLLFILTFLTPLCYKRKLLSRLGFYISCLGIVVFILGLWSRNTSWITLRDIIPYSLNYFDTLDLLLVVTKDFPAGFMETFWLPFNKFLTPIGLSDAKLYYDMSHYLTDIYFPNSWAIRATSQWPVEADLYLNFYFFGGLPLFSIFFFISGFLWSWAQRRATIASLFIGLFCVINILPHLRGSLYNHVDFYQIPMIFLAAFVLNRLVPGKKYSLVSR